MLPEIFDETPPHAGSIVESLRAFGYDLPTALADLIDNSISAGARNVWLKFEWAGAASAISVTDDGTGMTPLEIVAAMRFGSRNPLEPRAASDLGRFGLGLKTASLSQCRRLTVRSRRAGGEFEQRCWDLDTIVATNAWVLLRTIEPSSECYFEKLVNLDHGTCVVWEHLDRVTSDQKVENDKHHQRFLARVEGVRRHLSMVFHRLMSGKHAVNIFVNERPLSPWDPFLEGHEATHRLPVDPLRFNGIRIPVQPYVLPHFSKLTKLEHESGAGPYGWLAQQGFYVYRGDRLLVAGDWLGLGWTKDEHIKLARIAIDLPNTMDHEWQINVTKSKATPPLWLRDDLKRIAERTRFEAKNVYTHRGVRLTAQATVNRTLLWEPMAKHDRTFYHINRTHPLVKAALENSSDRSSLNALIMLLEETIPIQHIIIANTEKPDAQSQPFEAADRSQLTEVMTSLFRTLRKNGSTIEEARRMVGSHWPFELFPNLVASLNDL